MNRIKNSGIYTRVILCFTAILIAILLAVWLIVDTVCVNFIKEQRIQYNSQMIGKVSYEFSSIYLQMNQLLNSLNNLKRHISPDAETEGEGIYPRLKGDLEFETSIKSVMYSYDYQGFVNGILFYYGGGSYYYVGDGVNSSYYDFRIEDYQNLNANSGYTVTGPVVSGENDDDDESILRFVLKGNGQTAESEDPGPFVMAEVRMNKMEDRLEQVLSDDNVYCLIDAESHCVYSRGGKNTRLEEQLSDLIPRVVEHAGQEESTFAEGDVLVTSVSLKEFGWILAVADSQEILFQDISSLMLKVEMLIGICGILGILAAVITSQKLFFPIRLLRKIASEISEDRTVTSESIRNSEVTEVIELLKQMKSRIQELNARQYILEVREQEAQLQMLQAQINPHFLHNTLDNIYCIAQIEEIEPIICLTRNLSKMMRYSVNNQQMFVSLKEEIEHVQSYVEILNVRFEDAIALHIEVPEELKKARVIKLLLQPLVENSCLHGILPQKERSGNVWIRAEKQGNILLISVEDDGKGMDAGIRNRLNDVLQKKVKSIRTPKNEGFGIALVNVNDRIRLLDGENFGIRVEERAEGGCRVVILQKLSVNGYEK